MAISFNKILIPVDFSVNTETAVHKAIGLAGSGEVVIYLLHVIRGGQGTESKYQQTVAEKELLQWKYMIESHPGLLVRAHILEGRSVQKKIIEYASLIDPDLIIIGRHNDRHRWVSFSKLSPDTLAQISQCPVLTAKPGSNDCRTKVIVIPIRDFLPEKKLEWGILLARKYKAQVHLLAIYANTSAREGDLAQIFLKAYHHLREHLHHPIEYSSVTRNSPGRAVLNYAEQIMADLILVNPETESGIPGLTGSRHISDLLARDSKIQVLDV